MGFRRVMRRATIFDSLEHVSEFAQLSTARVVYLSIPACMNTKIT
jgi:hypothetical protein